MALAFGYRLDKYSVDEFGRSPEILNTPLITAFINTLYQWRPTTCTAERAAHLSLVGDGRNIATGPVKIRGRISCPGWLPTECHVFHV